MMLTVLFGVAAIVLATTLVLVFIGQKRLAHRLVSAGHRLSDDVVPGGTGLAEATSVVERAVDRALLWGGEGSMAEARLASALAVIPQGVVVFDDQGTIAYRNAVAASYLTARHGDALVEEAIADLADVATVTKEGLPPRTVDLFGPPRRTVVLKAIPLQDGGRRLGVLVVIDDVTDRRRLEGVRRDFVANISHELKTPVGALALLAETLLAEDDAAVAHRLAERMLAEAFRVGRTIDDLLELSRIEADEEARRDDVPVHLVIAEAVDRLRPAAEQRGITIEVEEPPQRLAVAGDRRQLVTATYNLLDNAVKYSDEGTSVHVGARTDGRWVDIEVEDHGIGIPRRDLERVFERFYRVDRARSRETGGTGLGLAIVRHVAGNHAGDVRVESTEGEGSTFTLRLPVGSGPVAVTAEAG
jgi:two-component system, OmpR family, sensor histidine kinase SenX3